ncbi:hypothetical protein [Myceligenerans xiligouense]|uniref:Antitoxin n=1 Tax=Myceligenerans xiligouense TaxID=253184 RepID=A0A3N4YTP5_9MICO|nr:hypothetical protein [Myceligenerans xiligouense]RPF22826.1 hypothetical protein EDD34_3499 [Myceligenerans xiligouense]
MSDAMYEPTDFDLIDPATVRTDVYPEYMVDLNGMGPGMSEMVAALTADPGRKIGITKNGRLVAVVIDPEDTKIFEGLEIEAESEERAREREEEALGDHDHDRADGRANAGDAR